MTDASKAGIVVVFCTAPPDSSGTFAERIVRERLVACVNIAGVSSRYLWQGEMAADVEDLLIMKTTKARLDDLCRFIREHHPYKIPEIIALPVVGGSEDYVAWVGERVSA